MCRQLAYLGGLPVNLQQAGVDDDLARLDQVVETAMADGAMLYNPRPVHAEGVRKILQRAHSRPGFSIPKSKRRLKPAAVAKKRKQITDAFANRDELYDIIGGFLQSLSDHPELGPTFLGTNLKIRFNYRNPEASITIDCTGDELRFEHGASDLKVDIEMSMEADFAHMFWLGKANLVSALTRRQVTSRGAVQKAVKLLPVLVPAFKLYPEFLRGKGLDDLVV
jgi:alcohol dehydrogenase